MTKRLFHLVPEEAWQQFWSGTQSHWRAPSLEQEGFLHLSFAEQLPETLRVHFDGSHPLRMIEVDARLVETDLRLEPSRGGEPFPHLYAALSRDAVLRTWVLRYQPEGWVLPPPCGD